MQVILHIKGMSCGHCVKTVEKALGEVPGVEKVQVDLASATATVDASGPLDMEAVRQRIEKAGYELV